MNKNSVFSKNLVYYRKLRNMSQNDLAKITGISTRMITYYENYVSHPSLEKIKIFADALEIDPEKLIKNNTETTKKNTIGDNIIDFSKINTKSLKQISKILELNKQNRAIIYRMIDELLEKQTKSQNE